MCRCVYASMCLTRLACIEDVGTSVCAYSCACAPISMQNGTPCSTWRCAASSWCFADRRLVCAMSRLDLRCNVARHDAVWRDVAKCHVMQRFSCRLVSCGARWCDAVWRLVAQHLSQSGRFCGGLLVCLFLWGHKVWGEGGKNVGGGDRWAVGDWVGLILRADVRS